MSDPVPPALRALLRQHEFYELTRCTCTACSISRNTVVATLRAVAVELRHDECSDTLHEWADAIEKEATK